MVITFMRFLGIISLLDNLINDLKVQWFSLWCQTRSYLSSHPKSSSVDHILAMSSLVSFSPTTSFSTSSKLVVSWYGLSIRVRRSSLASRLSYWSKIWIFWVSPQEASLVRSSRVENMGRCGSFWYCTISPGSSCPI